MIKKLAMLGCAAAFTLTAKAHQFETHIVNSNGENYQVDTYNVNLEGGVIRHYLRARLFNQGDGYIKLSEIRCNNSDDDGWIVLRTNDWAQVKVDDYHQGADWHWNAGSVE